MENISEDYKLTIMKELSIEQKAKRYDEALEIAKEINNEQRAQPFNVMTRVFPELAESEDDRMKKALIKLVKKTGEGYENVIDGVSIENAIAWLEKQVEHKPAEWNEEDDILRRRCIGAIQSSSTSEGVKNELVDWLKALRPQKQDVMSVDEFRHIVGYLVQDIVANEHMAEAEKQPTSFFVEKYYNKLRPQLHWKPSHDKMWALSTLVNIPESASDTCRKTVQELLEELKKLREE